MDKITRKTSFGQWFSPINLQFFEENMKTMKLDYYTKKLTTESFLKLLLFAQLQEIESLHALTDCLFDEQLQKEIDLDSISISQLSRRLNGINPNFFQQLFLDLVTQIHVKTHYTKLVTSLKTPDSSTLSLNLTHHRWATFRKTKTGVKLHLRLVFCLHVLLQFETKSKRKILQISRYLKAAFWKPAHIWHGWSHLCLGITFFGSSLEKIKN